jgi:hypothetical protein
MGRDGETRAAVTDTGGSAGGSRAGERPAFYALSPGGWRDVWSILHPPYTIWHLSYVVLGAATAPDIHVRWLLETLIAFFFAMGIGAHALDELRGRPLDTRIPSWALVVSAIVGVTAAVALGVDGMIEVSGWIGAFIVFGAFMVPAYNLELFRGFFHSDLWFAVAWGGFPALTAAFAQTGRLSWAAVAVALACAVISATQRVLSTPVRRMRRRVRKVEGRIVTVDGAVEQLDRRALIAAPERALRLMSLAMPLLAATALLAHANP